MARIGALGVGGYVPAPDEVVVRAAGLVDLGKARQHAILDPCAGAGEALFSLYAALGFADEDTDEDDEQSYWSRRQTRKDCAVYACELETVRATALEEAFQERFGYSHGGNVAKGDAFLLAPKLSDRYAGATVTWLNPPYADDKEHGRLEEKWLRRFTSFIVPGGALLFYVPNNALAASVDTIALWYDEVHCYRQPPQYRDATEENPTSPRQVIVVAQRRKHARLVPDPELQAKVRRWAEDLAGIPEITSVAGPVVVLPESVGPMVGFESWKIREIDVIGLLSAREPWQYTVGRQTRKTLDGIVPDGPWDQLVAPTYPIAYPPAPAHIGAGIAAGALSGVEVRPDNPDDPPCLIKGTFTRAYIKAGEDRNDDGDVVRIHEVQHPKLDIVVLDLSEYQYHTLKSDITPTGARTLDQFTVGDLMERYGKSLAEEMRRRCPSLYDPTRPGDLWTLPALDRPPIGPQPHVIRAAVRLLDETEDRVAILLAETGTGKTTMSSTTARVLPAAVAGVAGSRTKTTYPVLVMHPPHLRTTWEQELAVVEPRAIVHVLSSITDVDRVAELVAENPGRPIYAIMSREDAKLRHPLDSAMVKAGPLDRWAMAKLDMPANPDLHLCPSCGAAVSLSEEKAIGTKARCTHQVRQPADKVAQRAYRLAEMVATVAPMNYQVRHIIAGTRNHVRLAAHFTRKVNAKMASDMRKALVDAAWWCVDLAKSWGSVALDAAQYFLLAANLDEERAKVAERIAADHETVAQKIILQMTPGSALQDELVTKLSAGKAVREYYNPWGQVTAAIQALKEGREYDSWHIGKGRWKDGKIEVGNVRAETVDAAVHGISVLAQMGKWTNTKVCGSPLYQAMSTGESSRYPVARYIAKRHPKLFKLLIIDEAHEYSDPDSAQSRAAQLLLGIRMPTMLLTGSLSNGKSSSLFTLLWHTSSAFRAEFPRDGESQFVQAYGYQKRTVEAVERDETGKKQRVPFYGAMSDRVEKEIKNKGEAPGVLPSAVLKFILPSAITVRLEEFEGELPPCEEHTILVEPDKDLMERFDVLVRKLRDQIKRDRYSDKANKLIGQLARVPGYLDAATADVSGDQYEIRYPAEYIRERKKGKTFKTLMADGDLVAAVPTFPASTILPKEKVLIDLVLREISEGRNVLVFPWQVDLVPRIGRILSEAIGRKVPVLVAEKVPARDREAWITKNVTGKGEPVSVMSPACVKTGLNNLKHFATEIWLENPSCDAIMARQCRGRIVRIGQKNVQRLYWLVYKGTLQEPLYKLLQHKVGISQAVDGLDATAALEAAGVGGADNMVARDFCRAIHDLLAEDEAPGWAA